MTSLSTPVTRFSFVRFRSFICNRQKFGGVHCSNSHNSKRIVFWIQTTSLADTPIEYELFLIRSVWSKVIWKQHIFVRRFSHVIWFYTQTKDAVNTSTMSSPPKQCYCYKTYKQYFVHLMTTSTSSTLSLESCNEIYQYHICL